MYIQKLEIENIKGISELEIDFSGFDKPGWHVLIGDNGSGKTTILRALGMAMLGPKEIEGILARPDMSPSKWLKQGNSKAKVSIWILAQTVKPQEITLVLDREAGAEFGMAISDSDRQNYPQVVDPNTGETVPNVTRHIDTTAKFSFMAGYGPFRRLGKNVDSIFSIGKRQFFSTLFTDEEGMGGTEKWIKDLALDSNTDRNQYDILHSTIDFINDSELLPNGITMTKEVDSKGIKLTDREKNLFYFQEASDGIRTILSLAIDIIRSLADYLPSSIIIGLPNSGVIDFPGVILIDEVDAHLHPTWQIRIGNWFRKHFPKVQFIVATHSPLICRASEDSLIYRLVPEGSAEKSGPVSKTQHDRLVFGDILDAFGTQTFGENITSSKAAEDYRKRITILNKKSITGTITADESEELQNLKQFIQA